MKPINLHKAQSSLLRGGFCAIWIFAFLLGFFEYMFAVTADSGSPLQSIYIIRAGICLIVGSIAAVAHSILLKGALKKV